MQKGTAAARSITRSPPVARMTDWYPEYVPDRFQS